MKRLKKQFGARFAELVESSPTLRKDVAELRANKVKIVRLTSGVCRAYSLCRPRKLGGSYIFIATSCDVTTQVLYLAHEACHVLRGKVPSLAPEIAKMPKRAFVQRSITEEVRCVMHEIKVTKELFRARHKLPYHCLFWYTLYLEGGRKAIRAEVERIESSLGGNYRELYGAVYDRSA